MSLRTHLDRYCMQRAMTTELILSPSRSRSPTPAPLSSSIGPSPFHRPTGWQPPTTSPQRPVILKIDLKPMQQLANRDPYYNILAPQVADNLSMNMTACYKPTRLSTRTTQDDIPLMRSKLWWWTLWHNVGESFSTLTLRTPTSWLRPTRAPRYWITLGTRYWTSSTGTTRLGKPINISTPSPTAPLRFCHSPHIQTLRTLAWWLVFEAFPEGIRFIRLHL